MGKINCFTALNLMETGQLRVGHRACHDLVEPYSADNHIATTCLSQAKFEFVIQETVLSLAEDISNARSSH